MMPGFCSGAGLKADGSGPIAQGRRPDREKKDEEDGSGQRADQEESTCGGGRPSGVLAETGFG